MANIISPERFNQLKNKVKAECTRRRGNGSVSNYSTSSYDFVNTPANGIDVITDHFNKLAIPTYAILGTPPRWKSGYSGIRY